MTTTTELSQEALLAADQAPRVIDLPAGVPVLSQLYLYVSGACNLACRHCWITPTFQREGNGGSYIPLHYVEKAIQEGQPLGLTGVKLTGGEPTLHPQFRELVKLVDEAGLRITMETNGTLIDDDLAVFLRQRAGVRLISVSLDGATAQTHDALRSVPGSYQQAVNGIAALVRAGFQPQVICTLHQGNLTEMQDLVALAERLGCGSVKFNHLQEIGRGEQFASQQGLDVPDMLSLAQQTRASLATSSPLPIFFDIPLAFHTIGSILRVGAGQCHILNILGVLSSGELALCGIGTSIPELVYGHIAQADLRTVWCSSPGLASLRAQVPAQLIGICGACLHRDYCLGDCVAHNYHATGQLNSAFSFCERAEALGLFPASRKRLFVS